MKTPKRALVALLTLLAVLAGGGTILITADDGHTPPQTLTIPVDGLDAGDNADRTVEVPKTAVDAAAPRLENDLRDEAPPAVATGDLADAAAAIADIVSTQLPLPTAGATAGFAGCRTSFVRNQSSRGGVRPNVQVLHYTVSPNRPGWSDVDAIVALFNRSSSQASSHFVIDAEGNCAYIVPIEAKSWTQAAGNPFGISYEVIATGKETKYLPAAGMAKLRSVVDEVAKRTGIPLRRGAVNGCTPTRSGIVEHRDGGTCWGGHIDITPFPVDAIVADLITGSITAVDKTTCRKLNWWRNAGRPAGAPQRNASRRKNALTARGVTCTPTGPVRT